MKGEDDSKRMPRIDKILVSLTSAVASCSIFFPQPFNLVRAVRILGRDACCVELCFRREEFAKEFSALNELNCELARDRRSK
jgi:hypothetical protein